MVENTQDDVATHSTTFFPNTADILNFSASKYSPGPWWGMSCLDLDRDRDRVGRPLSDNTYNILYKQNTVGQMGIIHQ